MIKLPTRDYEAFTANERASLAIRALSRSDDQEFERLLQTAPKKTTTESHHWPAMIAILYMGLEHKCTLLELAARHLTFSFMIYEDRDPAGKAVWCRLLSAYEFHFKHAAFLTFLERRGVGMENLVDTFPIDLASSTMSETTFSWEEMEEFASEFGHEWNGPKDVDARANEIEATFKTISRA